MESTKIHYLAKLHGNLTSGIQFARNFLIKKYEYTCIRTILQVYTKSRPIVTKITHFWLSP